MHGEQELAEDRRPLDPGDVHTLSELKQALKRLRGSRSYARLNRVASGRLPKSTINNVLAGRTVPRQDTMVAFLMACDLDEDAQTPWLAALERVATAHLARPAGAVRVSDAQARLLGVHAAIRFDGVKGDLPPYVPRDLDADLRVAITDAAVNGGFVVLVGDSSVGKSRTLFEAVRAALPEWWLLHPSNSDAVRALADDPTPRTVLWLDELQRYLDTPPELPAGVVRTLLAAGVVVAATLWPYEYTVRRAARKTGEPDSYANDRELLGMARVVDVPDALTTTELRRAEAFGNDPRIRSALDTPDVGFTQVLAAGPELIRWWENAASPYGKALITAALDARRVGAHHPVTRNFLAAATPTYLSSAQQATAPPDWLDRALRYATTLQHGATGTLTPVAAGMGDIGAYTTADYLHQHARRVRRNVRLFDEVWQAIVDHHHPADAATLAEEAERRGRHQYAEALDQEAADAGDELAGWRLAWLLSNQGRVDDLRLRADTGDPSAARRLASILTEQGSFDEALEVLRPHAGHEHAGRDLVDLLIKQRHAVEAFTLLRQRGDGGNVVDGQRVAELLVEQGRAEDVRVWADAGNIYASIILADLLVEQGRIADLQARAEAGDVAASNKFADILFEESRDDELRDLADTGNAVAQSHYAEALVTEGRIDDLCAKADAGNVNAAARLAHLLAEQGREDDLRARADAGDYRAARQLAERLAEQGRIQGAVAILHSLAVSTASWDARRAADRLADLLTEHGNIDGAIAVLRALGTAWAGDRLARLLAAQRRVDELRTLVDDPHVLSAPDLLAELLAEQGEIDELRRRADAGDWAAAGRLVEWLANHGHHEALQNELYAGTFGASEHATDPGDPPKG